MFVQETRNAIFTSCDNITPLGLDSGEFLMGLSLEKQMVAIVLAEGGSSSTGLSAPYCSTSANLIKI